jgi:hypothetical protein
MRAGIIVKVGQFQACGVELAGPVHGGGNGGTDARQDAQARQTTAADRHRAESGRPGARAAAGRNNPLDRPDAGESRRGEPAFGATYSRSTPTRAASHPYVQAVERPEVNTDPRPSVQIRTSYSSHRK